MGDEPKRPLAELLADAAPLFEPVSGDHIRGRTRSRSRSTGAVLSVAAACVVIIVTAVGLTLAVGRHGDHRPGPGSGSSDHVDLSARGLDTIAQRAPCSRTTSGEGVGAANIAKFDVVAVVNCKTAVRKYDDGLWQIVIRQVSAVGVARLKSALVRPNEPPASGSCSLIGYLPPKFLVVDPAGKYLHPAFPVGSCGGPQTSYTQALAAVSFRTVSITKVKLVEPRVSLDSGCPQDYKNLRVMDGNTASHAPARLNNGSPIRPPRGGSRYVCVYGPGKASDVGLLDRPVMLKAADRSKLLVALAEPGRSGTCPTQQRFAVLGNVTVELGGCWRVTRGDTDPTTEGRADPIATKRLLGLT